MSARWTSRLTLILAPLAVLACGDDTTGSGGGGGVGGEGTTSSTTSTPTSVTTTTTVTATSTSTGSDGGGGSGEGGTGEGGTGEGGGSGGAGGGGTIIDVDGGEEACPGDDPAIEIAVGAGTYLIEDSTEGLADDHDTCFSGDPDDFEGGDLVYAITLDATASLVVQLTDGADTDANLSVRTTCDSNETADGFCYDHTSNGDVKTHATEAAAGNYFIIVDSDAAAEGDFELTITATTPACGDGILNTGEECDVGPAGDDDGCVDPGLEEECTTEQALAELDACPGEDIDIAEGMTRLLATDGNTTIGFTDDYDGSCTGAFLGLDRVYMFTPAVTGTMTVEIGLNDQGAAICLDADDPLCWDYAIYANSVCGDDALTELDCSDFGYEKGQNEVEAISFPVVATVPVYVFVDGYDGMDYSQGPFDLDITLVGDL